MARNVKMRADHIAQPLDDALGVAFSLAVEIDLAPREKVAGASVGRQPDPPGIEPRLTQLNAAILWHDTAGARNSQARLRPEGTPLLNRHGNHPIGRLSGFVFAAA